MWFLLFCFIFWDGYFETPRIKGLSNVCTYLLFPIKRFIWSISDLITTTSSPLIWSGEFSVTGIALTPRARLPTQEPWLISDVPFLQPTTNGWNSTWNNWRHFQLEIGTKDFCPFYFCGINAFIVISNFPTVGYILHYWESALWLQPHKFSQCLENICDQKRLWLILIIFTGTEIIGLTCF